MSYSAVFRLLPAVSYIGFMGITSLSGAASAEGVSRALVIGVDDYIHEAILPDLDGAVNDARDLDSAFQEIGIQDRTMLLNDQATRPNIFAAWEALLERSEPGDRIFVTYAGHGMRKEAGPDSSEEDGFDEFWAFHGFSVDPADPGVSDMILDDEVNSWIRAAEDRGVEVVLVVDACHSGTSFRAIDERVRGVTYRFSSVIGGDDLFAGLDLETLTDEAATAIPENLLTFAAADDSEVVPELYLPDHETGELVKRGAMSYYFARGLRGAADSDIDGTITFAEMREYVVWNIATESAAMQTPNVLAAGGDLDRELAATSPSGPDLALPVERTVRLKVLGAEKPPLLDGTELVAASEQADLIWDTNTGEVVSGLDTVVALGVAGDDLQPIVDKLRARRLLAALGERAPVDLRMVPERPIYRQQELVTLSIPDLRFQHLILLNIANSGTVQFIYPWDESGFAAHPPGEPFELSGLEIVPPFGADLVVAITTDRPQMGLVADLEALSGQRNPLGIVETVRERLSPGKYGVGLFSFYTCEFGAERCES